MNAIRSTHPSQINQLIQMSTMELTLVCQLGKANAQLEKVRVYNVNKAQFTDPPKTESSADGAS